MAIAETKVSERPILFKPEMVLAIIDGKKTQTRRAVSPRNSTVLGYPGRSLWNHLVWNDEVYVDGGPDPFGCPGYQYLHVPAWNPVDGPVPKKIECRYRVRPVWRAEDELWVREPWSVFHHKNYGDALHIAYGGVRHSSGACYPIGAEHWEKAEKYADAKWRSPIHMPRWAARLILEVTVVRVERLEEISEEDAKAEGAIPEFAAGVRVGGVGHNYYIPLSHRAGFCNLWNRINGNTHPWGCKLWVWVIEFKRKG